MSSSSVLWSQSESTAHGKVSAIEHGSWRVVARLDRRVGRLLRVGRICHLWQQPRERIQLFGVENAALSETVNELLRETATIPWPYKKFATF